MKIQIEKSAAERINARFSRYNFEVGILKDSKYKEPRSKREGLSTLAKGPVRRTSRNASSLNVSDVSAFNRGDSHDYLVDPFRRPVSKDSSLLKRFLAEFLKLTGKNTNVRRLENLLQAMVRNPMARGDYGSNAKSTVRRKGFDRFMIDTGQLFRSIKARVVKGNKRV